MLISPTMIAAGAHVLSEWFNDNAPIGEHVYREPAKQCFEAMLAALVDRSDIPPPPRKEAPRP